MDTEAEPNAGPPYPAQASAPPEHDWDCAWYRADVPGAGQAVLDGLLRLHPEDVKNRRLLYGISMMKDKVMPDALGIPSGCVGHFIVRSLFGSAALNGEIGVRQSPVPAGQAAIPFLPICKRLDYWIVASDHNGPVVIVARFKAGQVHELGNSDEGMGERQTLLHNQSKRKIEAARKTLSAEQIELELRDRWQRATLTLSGVHERIHPRNPANRYDVVTAALLAGLPAPAWDDWMNYHMSEVEVSSEPEYQPAAEPYKIEVLESLYQEMKMDAGIKTNNRNLPE